MITVSTAEEKDTKLQITQRNSQYSSAVVLPATGARLHKNTNICRVHSKEIFQQL